MVKLEYSRYNATLKYEWVSGDLFYYTNGSHETFC